LDAQVVNARADDGLAVTRLQRRWPECKVKQSLVGQARDCKLEINRVKYQFTVTSFSSLNPLNDFGAGRISAGTLQFAQVCRNA